MKKYTSNITNIPNTDNYHIKDCPVLIPKENLKTFQALLKACETTPYSPETFGNQYTGNNKK